MKCLLHSVPVGRCLAFVLPISIGITTTLSAQNERDTSVFVDKSDSLTIPNRRASSKSDFFDVHQNTGAFSRNFDLSAEEKREELPLQRPPGQQRKVVFDFQTTGKHAAVYSCELIIDSTFQNKLMSCCDVVLTTPMLAPHVAIRKAGSNLSVASYPLSSYYPIVAYGDGTLVATGSNGYFFVPPNLYSGSQPIQLKGAGPHKVYWLGEDHPDSSPLDHSAAEESAVEDATVRFISGKWQRRIRLQ